MDIKKATTVYLILSIFLCFCVPFTGLVALYYAIKAKNVVAVTGANIQEFMDKSFRWIIITISIFIIVYPLLILFFFMMPRM